jgi:hypothetical protein
MPKMHRGSTIGDKFITIEMIIVIFLDFPHDPDKAHQGINYIFTSFVNICLSRISFDAEGDRAIS